MDHDQRNFKNQRDAVCCWFWAAVLMLIVCGGIALLLIVRGVIALYQAIKNMIVN